MNEILHLMVKALKQLFGDTIYILKYILLNKMKITYNLIQEHRNK